MPEPVPNRCARLIPALGTYVRIEAEGRADVLEPAIGAARDAVNSVHRCMSFHESRSALHDLHRAPLEEVVSIDLHLWNVLQLSKSLHEQSEGKFDPSIARSLVTAGLLPQPSDLLRPDPDADLSALELPAIGKARLTRRIWLDLGGIAKGYAVDLALSRLKEFALSSGSVNAGGDLACFGSSHRVGLRHPRLPQQLASCITLNNETLATSAESYVQGALLPGKGHLAQRNTASVSVIAASCAIADALTKVIWFSTEESARQILGIHRARSLIADKRGNVRWLN